MLIHEQRSSAPAGGATHLIIQESSQTSTNPPKAGRTGNSFANIWRKNLGDISRHAPEGRAPAACFLIHAASNAEELNTKLENSYTREFLFPQGRLKLAAGFLAFFRIQRSHFCPQSGCYSPIFREIGINSAYCCARLCPGSMPVFIVMLFID